MPSGDLIAIRMELLGAGEVAAESKVAASGIAGVGTSSKAAAAQSVTAGQRLRSAMGGAFAKIRTAAKWATAGLIAFAAIAIKKSIDATEEFVKTVVGLHRNLNLSVADASRWGAVLKSRDIDTKSAGMAFKTLSTQLVTAAREGGEAMTPFNQLGISLQDVRRGAKDFSWFLDTRLPNALGKAEGGARRFSAASKLLGRGYQTILPLFADGAKGLREQLHWADKYNVTLSGKGVDSLFEFTMAQRENKVAMLGMQIMIAQKVIPALTSLIGFFDKLVRGFESLSPGGKKVVLIIGAMVLAIPPLIIGISSLTAALATLLGVETAVLAPFIAIPLALVAVGVAFVVLYKKVKWFRDIVDRAWAIIKGFAEFMFKVAKVYFAPVTIGLVAIVKVVKLVIKHFGSLKGAVASAARWILDKFGAVVDFFKALPGRIAGFFSGLASSIADGFKGPINSVIAVINDAITAFNKLPGPDIGLITPIGAGGPPQAPISGPTGTRGPRGPGSHPQGPKGPSGPAGRVNSPAAAGPGVVGRLNFRVEVPVVIDGREVARATTTALRNQAARR